MLFPDPYQPALLKEIRTSTDTKAVPRTGYFHRDECKCAEAQMGISLGIDGATVWFGRWVE